MMDGKVSQYKLEREIKKSIMAGNEPDCERAVRVAKTLVGENRGKQSGGGRALQISIHVHRYGGQFSRSSLRYVRYEQFLRSSFG